MTKPEKFYQGIKSFNITLRKYEIEYMSRGSNKSSPIISKGEVTELGSDGIISVYGWHDLEHRFAHDDGSSYMKSYTKNNKEIKLNTKLGTKVPGGKVLNYRLVAEKEIKVHLSRVFINVEKKKLFGLIKYNSEKVVGYTLYNELTDVTQEFDTDFKGVWFDYEKDLKDVNGETIHR